MFASIKQKFKDKAKKPADPSAIRKQNRRFYDEHAEEFRYFVKYFAVFQSIALAVSREEMDKLNKTKPCVFRQESEIPFKSKCEILANDGTAIKTIKDCKECCAQKNRRA